MMSGPHFQMFVTSEQSLRKTSRSSSSDLISTQALHIESQRLLLSCARCQRTTLPCIAPRKGCTALNPMLTSSSSCCSSCPALGLCLVCFQDLEAWPRWQVMTTRDTSVTKHPQPTSPMKIGVWAAWEMHSGRESFIGSVCSVKCASKAFASSASLLNPARWSYHLTWLDVSSSITSFHLTDWCWQMSLHTSWNQTRKNTNGWGCLHLRHWSIFGVLDDLQGLHRKCNLWTRGCRVGWKGDQEAF